MIDLPIIINNAAFEIVDKDYIHKVHSSAGYIKLKTLQSH